MRKVANPFSCHRTHGSARGFHYPALAQEKSADTMELLRQKMKADKKLVVGPTRVDGVRGAALLASTRTIGDLQKIISASSR